MATTSGNLAAGKAPAGQGGKGEGSNKGRVAAVVATAALGLSLVAGGILGHGRQAAQSAQSSANPFAGDAHVATMWDFREDRRAETSDLFIPDQFTYREDRRAEARDLFVPGPFTYREDRRVESAAPAWSPDFWTYREDRRDH